MIASVHGSNAAAARLLTEPTNALIQKALEHALVFWNMITSAHSHRRNAAAARQLCCVHQGPHPEGAMQQLHDNYAASTKALIREVLERALNPTGSLQLQQQAGGEGGSADGVGPGSGGEFSVVQALQGLSHEGFLQGQCAVLGTKAAVNV
eukprot:scaffold110919_cov20-Tisochrysis_lutea.AAC.3